MVVRSNIAIVMCKLWDVFGSPSFSSTIDYQYQNVLTVVKENEESGHIGWGRRAFEERRRRRKRWWNGLFLLV